MFKKGDVRINRLGQMSKNRLTFNRTLRELIVEEGEQLYAGTMGGQTVKLKKVQWLVKSVWNAAIKGESWAVTFIAERTEGKVTQPVSGPPETGGVLNIKVVQVKDQNGNGNAEKEG